MEIQEYIQDECNYDYPSNEELDAYDTMIAEERANELDADNAADRVNKVTMDIEEYHLALGFIKYTDELADSGQAAITFAKFKEDLDQFITDGFAKDLDQC